MRYKPDFDRARQYWRAFWAQEVIDRPCVYVTAPKKDVEPSPLWISPALSYFACIRDEWNTLLPRFERSVASTYYGGEAFPQLDLTLGPDEYAAFLGGALQAQEGNFTTWSHPVVDDLEGYHPVIDRSENGYFEIFRRALAKATAYAQDKFFVNMLDYHSHFDALCALRDPQELCMDLLDCPDEAQRVLDEVAATYPDIYRMVYETGDMARRGCCGWPPVYVEEGKFAVVSSDYSCLLGEEQGRRFVLPYVEQEVSFLDRSLYHLDGKDALVHLDNLLAVEGIHTFQWVPGDGAPRSIEWMELLHKIQAAGKSLWIYDWTPEEIMLHFKELDPAKVVFSTSCATEDDAERLLAYLKAHM